MSARTYKMSEFKILTLCAGRTPEQIAEAFRLLDNREKVVEKLGSIINDEMFVTPRTRSMARAALALLQAEKELSK